MMLMRGMKEKGAQFSVQMHLWPNILSCSVPTPKTNIIKRSHLFSNRYTREFKSGLVILVILRKYSN